MRIKNMSGSTLGIVAIIIFALLFTVYRFCTLGAFVSIENDTQANRETVAIVKGPEALQIDQEAGRLYFISSNPCKSSNDEGAIYYLDIKSNNNQAIPFGKSLPEDFHPHGLSLLKSEGKTLLFTNNHRQSGSHTVEIFEQVDQHRLRHLETISSDKLTSPNDLVAIGPKQFYLTNDGRSHDKTTRSIDTFLGLATGNVMYYDGEKFHKVIDNLHFPNGIAFNQQTRELIVTETLSGDITTFQMDEPHTPRFIDKHHLGIGIDNIYLKPASTELVVALHPNLWALSKHMNGEDKPSPSRIIQFNYRVNHSRTLFQHTGEYISGVSAAILYKNSLFLGAVCDNKLVKVSL